MAQPPTDDTPNDNRIAYLEDRLANLRTLLDLVPHFMYVIDRDGRYRMANRATAESLGHSVDSILEHRFQDLVAKPEQALALIDEANRTMDRGLPKITPQAPMRLLDGRDITMQLHEVPYRDEATGEDCLLGIATDVTAQHELATARVEQARLERELSIAKSIQESLLPTAPPACARYELAGWSRPAEQTGGDFYDWFVTPDGTTYAVLGDVTGHGLGPALIAATTRAYVRALFAGPQPITEKMSRLNTMLYNELPSTMFVTLATLEMPRDRGEACSFVSAGHGPSFVRLGSAVEPVGSHAPPLGVVSEAPYDEPDAIDLEDAGLFTMASDGFHERFDERGEQLGADALASVIDAHAGDARALIYALVETTDRFGAGAEQGDDMTAVVVTPRR